MSDFVFPANMPIACVRCGGESVTTPTGGFPEGWIIQQTPIKAVVNYGDTIWAVETICPECNEAKYEN